MKSFLFRLFSLFFITSRVVTSRDAIKLLLQLPSDTILKRFYFETSESHQYKMSFYTHKKGIRVK